MSLSRTIAQPWVRFPTGDMHANQQPSRQRGSTFFRFFTEVSAFPLDEENVPHHVPIGSDEQWPI